MWESFAADCIKASTKIHHFDEKYDFCHVPAMASSILGSMENVRFLPVSPHMLCMACSALEAPNIVVTM
jgi:hypothetical protein